MALDTNGNLLWKTSSSSKTKYPAVTSIDIANNVVVGAGAFTDTMYWGSKQVVNPIWSMRSFMVRVSAAAGTLIGVDQIETTGSSQPQGICIDRNSNVYISGIFNGTLTFATNSFTKPGSSVDEFLAKYRNTQCNCDLLQPSLSYTNTGVGSFQFTYTGQLPYTSISWDFGDGTPATSTAAPSHTYSQPGSYPVCVTVTNGCGNNTSCQFVVVTVTGINDPDGADAIRVYPNPVGRELMVEGVQTGTLLQVYDLTGRLMHQQTVTGAQTRMDVRALPMGSYLLRCVDKEGRSSGKVFVKE